MTVGRCGGGGEGEYGESVLLKRENKKKGEGEGGKEDSPGTM